MSFHLAVLKAAGLITDRRQGKWTHYRIVEGDLYRRFLVLSALERIDRASAEPDQNRLGEFLANKSRRCSTRAKTRHGWAVTTVDADCRGVDPGSTPGKRKHV